MRGYLQSMGTLLMPPPLKKMSFPPLATSKCLEILGRGAGRDAVSCIPSTLPGRWLAQSCAGITAAVN